MNASLRRALATAECLETEYQPGEWHPDCEVVRINHASKDDNIIRAMNRTCGHQIAASLALDGQPSRGPYLSPPCRQVRRGWGPGHPDAGGREVS